MGSEGGPRVNHIETNGETRLNYAQPVEAARINNTQSSQEQRVKEDQISTVAKSNQFMNGDAKINVPIQRTSPTSPTENHINQSHDPVLPQLEETEDLSIKTEKVYTTLLRNQTGLGFSIAGGKGAVPYMEGSHGLYISKISDDGAASKDGKLRVGDKIVQINGVDVTNEDHKQAIAMLTGNERFVRLVVERKSLVPRIDMTNITVKSMSEKSPKVFGLPKPYTGLYSSNSYMANRPGLRTREAGNYGKTLIGASESLVSNSNLYNKLPGLSAVPGADSPTATSLLYKGERGNSSTSLLFNKEQGTSSSKLHLRTAPSPGPISSQDFQKMIPDSIKSKIVADFEKDTNGEEKVDLEAKESGNIKDMVLDLENRSNAAITSKLTNLGVVTESITKTTFTETTVKRVLTTKWYR